MPLGSEGVQFAAESLQTRLKIHFCKTVETALNDSARTEEDFSSIRENKENFNKN